MEFTSWVEVTRLLTKIEETETEPIRSIQLERSHLRFDQDFDINVRSPFKYGDFTILAAKIEGKKGDIRNLRRRKNKSK